VQDKASLRQARGELQTSFRPETRQASDRRREKRREEKRRKEGKKQDQTRQCKEKEIVTRTS
jgi:hypothetical protein